MTAHSLLIISSAPPMLDRRTYCNPYCNRASTHRYTVDKAIPPDHRKPPKQAQFPDVVERARTYASKLVAGAGQRFESARRLSILSRFAGKTLSGAKAPALRQGRFTATRLLRSTHHSSCCLIFDSRWYLTPLRRNGTIASGLTSYSSREPRSKQHGFPGESRATNSPLSSSSPQRRSSSALALLLLPASPHTS
jgi:hypothetical protein